MRIKSGGGFEMALKVLLSKVRFKGDKADLRNQQATKAFHDYGDQADLNQDGDLVLETEDPLEPMIIVHRDEFEVLAVKAA